MFPEISAAPRSGALPAARAQLWKEDEPIIDFSDDGHWLWFDISGNAKTYLFCLALLGIAMVVAKNLIRTRTGRALQAIRDRDVAAEVMGIPEAKYKLIAFAISSFFAGIAGALFASFVGSSARDWDLILSVEFIAILLIGGAGTTAGVLIGTFFVVMSPRFVEDVRAAGWAGRPTGDGPSPGSGTSSSAPAPATSGSSRPPHSRPGSRFP